MARLSLKAMRENVEKKTPGGSFTNEFWTPMDNVDLNSSAIVRFLPFEDTVSGGFWTIQKSLKTYFTNPDNPDDIWTVTIPCLEMYGEAGTVSCPVANEVRAVFKDADELTEGGNSDEGERLKKAALPHWIRYSYLFQGFVQKGGNKPVDQNEIVPMRFPKSMWAIVANSVTDKDSGFETLPCGSFDMNDIEAVMTGEMPVDDETGEVMDQTEFLALFTGRNFVCKKTKKDKFNNYETSTWELKESDLTEDQISAIAENGLIDLRKFLPKQPTAEQYEVYAEMMRISIGGELGTESNEWNPEWETVHGIKPNKGKNSDDGEGGGSSRVSRSSGGGDVKSKLKAKLDAKSGDKEGSSGSAADVRAKLNKSRGAKAAEADESADQSDQSSDEADDAPAEAAPKANAAMSLSERLKAKTAAAKAAANA